MSHLSIIFPRLAKRQLPLSRDQLVLLLAAANEIILGIDIYLAHSISGTIIAYEWIPIIFGPLAGIILLAVGLLAFRRRRQASALATLIFIVSIMVGLLGTYFHFNRAILQDAPLNQIISLDLMVWAPPLFGPIAFAGIGLLGISAAWEEDPPNSGSLKIWRGLRLNLPYPKTNAYYLMLSLGILAALISSAFDHARTGFENPWLWLPTASGVFAVIVTAYIGAIRSPSRADLLTYFSAMLLIMIVGLIGAVLHVQVDLTAGSQFVQERFLRGAPVLAPLQFCNLAMLGFIIMLGADEGKGEG